MSLSQTSLIPSVKGDNNPHLRNVSPAMSIGILRRYRFAMSKKLHQFSRSSSSFGFMERSPFWSKSNPRIWFPGEIAQCISHSRNGKPRFSEASPDGCGPPSLQNVAPRTTTTKCRIEVPFEHRPHRIRKRSRYAATTIWRCVGRDSCPRVSAERRDIVEILDGFP